MQESDINRFLKEIVNTMNEAITIISPDGAILMVNRAMEEITGYSREELIGNSCSIFHCDACEKARAEADGRWCRLFHVGHSRRQPCSILQKSGFYAQVLKNASLLEDGQGNVVAAVETFTDVTAIRERDERIEQLSRLLEGRATFHGLVGESAKMQRVFEIIEKAAQSEAPVSIFGETGTGKELVARAIHDLGSRRTGPYIQLNCAALNESLLESELFGHVKGAFTGAHVHRKGRFEAADGGDIFLDEIGDIPLSMQVKLLRVLETRQFERVGDLRPINTDVRIITATNRDLDRLAAEGKFREDLFFRINIIPIHLPPLRERPEDIPLLVDHFIHLLREAGGKQVSGPDSQTMDLFMKYHWPGNVRELRGALEYAFVLADHGAITPDHLPVRIKSYLQRRECVVQDTAPAPASTEKTALLEALAKCGGNQTRAARMLGVNRVTVWHRMKKHGIELRDLP
ncbi:MAG: sigma-54 interaction domain-containing protein [Syntrophobacteraceae bacterium]